MEKLKKVTEQFRTGGRRYLRRFISGNNRRSLIRPHHFPGSKTTQYLNGLAENCIQKFIAINEPTKIASLLFENRTTDTLRQPSQFFALQLSNFSIAVMIGTISTLNDNTVIRPTDFGWRIC